MMKLKSLLCLALALVSMLSEAAPPFRPPAFIGGIPGKAQFQAIQIQRHQARTLLYREALEELRKNPKAADVPECPTIAAGTRTLCIRAAKVQPAPDTPSGRMDAEHASTAATGSTPEVTPGGLRRKAVLFGNSRYNDPIPSLNTPIADVDRIAEILRSRFGYETEVIHDAGKVRIIDTLNRVAAESRPDDSVLLFYAGHGYLMDDTKMGFWIPVDASVRTAANWISNTDITKLLRSIPSRQVILISDSCFSGSLTREQKVRESLAPKEADILRQRSVLALSSGDEEPVSDEGLEGHSIFAWHFIKTMQTLEQGISPGFDIYRSVHDGVRKSYPQEPQYGAVYSAGHMSGGEYLFSVQ